MVTLSSDDSRRKISLKFRSLLDFDREIQSGYHAWVENAPPEWKEDQFFIERFPICVTSRYGQDQDIGDENELEEEALNWFLDRDFSRVRFFNVAIATHLWYARLLIVSMSF